MSSPQVLPQDESVVAVGLRRRWRRDTTRRRTYPPALEHGIDAERPCPVRAEEEENEAKQNRGFLVGFGEAPPEAEGCMAHEIREGHLAREHEGQWPDVEAKDNHLSDLGPPALI